MTITFSPGVIEMNRNSSSRPRIVSTLGVAAVAALALSGCTWFNPPVEEEKPPVVAIDALDVPTSMLPTKTTADVSTVVVPGTDALPWLLGGAAVAPGGRATPTVWTSEDGRAWTDHVVDPDFEGSFGGELAASEQLAALGGTAWHEGTIRSAVFVSGDRTAWSEVELPAEFASQFRVYQLVVVENEVFGIATDTSGASMGVRIDGDEVEQFELPSVPDGDLLYATDLVAGDDALLLVAEPGPEGDPNDIVTYRSENGGDTWADPVPVTDHLGHIGGTVWTGDRFVSTGGSPQSSTQGAPLLPAVWVSDDGSSWQPESPAAAIEFGVDNFSTSNAWFGRPLATDGVITAVIAANNLAFSTVFERSTDGAWRMLGRTAFNPGNGVGGSALPLADGGTLALIGESTYWRVGVLSDGWTDSTVLGERERFFRVQAIVAAGEQDLIVLTKGNFAVETGGAWRNFTTLGLAEATGDTIAETAWEPERAAELTGLRIASDESGAEVRVGSFFPPGGGVILAEGWFKSTPEDEWTRLAGFEGSGATYFNAAAKTGDTWTAVGTYRASSNVGDPSHGIIWTSSDGTNWTRAAGEFGEGRLETEVEAVCTLPNGDPVAVGWVEQAAGEFRTAVWMPDDAGSWNLASIGELGERSGSAYDCATGEDGVVMRATVSGRTTLQLSADGTEWEEVFRSERGQSLGEPVAVPGGFAATGSWTRGEFSGPVVWLSADGVEWVAVSVESSRNGSTTHVAPYGDNLLVTMSGDTGHPVSVIRDIEQTIADHTG